MINRPPYRKPAQPCPPPYDPTVEYGLLTIAGGIEAGLSGADTLAGITALDGWFARASMIGNCNLSGSALYRLPDMHRTYLEYGFEAQNLTLGDKTLHCDYLPRSYGYGGYVNFTACRLNAVDGDVSRIFVPDEWGYENVEFNFCDCDFPQAAIDAILSAAVSYPYAEYANNILVLNGGTSAQPSAAGMADAATLQGWGWTVYYNEAD